MTTQSRRNGLPRHGLPEVCHLLSRTHKVVFSQGPKEGLYNGGSSRRTKQWGTGRSEFTRLGFSRKNAP